MYVEKFKSHFKVAFDDWLLANPGRRMSIYEISELSGKAFKKCGIVPFETEVFYGDNF